MMVCADLDRHRPRGRLRSLKLAPAYNNGRPNEKADISTWHRSGHLYLALTHSGRRSRDDGLEMQYRFAPKIHDNIERPFGPWETS